MAAGGLKRAAYTVALAFGTLLWLSVLLLFSQVAQNSDEFARLQPWILLVNVKLKKSFKLLFRYLL